VADLRKELTEAVYEHTRRCDKCCGFDCMANALAIFVEMKIADKDKVVEKKSVTDREELRPKLTDEEMLDIADGLADVQAGRTKPVEQVRAEIRKREELRKKLAALTCNLCAEEGPPTTTVVGEPAHDMGADCHIVCASEADTILSILDAELAAQRERVKELRVQIQEDIKALHAMVFIDWPSKEAQLKMHDTAVAEARALLAKEE